MKHLGIDYGAKHVGLAISNTDGTIAMPYNIIPNDAFLVSEIEDVLWKEGAEKIVIGDSKNLDGTDNIVNSQIKYFISKLEEKNIKVESINETFSSRAAKWGTVKDIRTNPKNAKPRTTGKKEPRIDDKAATILLQTYLDTL